MINTLLFVGVSLICTQLQSEPDINIDLDSVISQDSSLIIETDTDTLPGDIAEQISDLDKEPQLISFVKALYPDSLVRSAITGVITLDLLVSDSGTVDSIHITRGLHPVLDSAVAAAVRQFVFTPAIADSVPVPVILTYEYSVTLDEIVNSIQEFVNFSGILYERGTRTVIRDAEVFITFPDSTTDTTIRIPFGMYLNKIGSFEGQRRELNAIVTVTDSSGRFRFKSLPAGPGSVIIPVAGYEPFQSDDTVTTGEMLDVVYRLQKTSYAEYEIVVYGKSEEKEVSRRTLTLAEVKKIPGFGGDAVKVVQAMPGVARPTFGGGSITVRGARSWDSKFYIDGIQIPQLYHFGGLKSTYNSDALKSVDLYPGGFGVRYGSTIAGVIELTSRNATPERIRGFADVNLFDATAFVEGPLNKNSGIILSARRSYIGDILGYITKKGFFNIPITVVPFYYDYLARFNSTLNEKNSITATVFGSHDELELIAPFVRGGSSEIDNFTDRIRQQVGFTMLNAGWDVSLSERFTNSMAVSLIPGEGFSSVFGRIKIEFDSWEYVLREEFRVSINKLLTLSTGAYLWYQNYHQIGAFPNPGNDNTYLRDTTDLKLGNIGPYAQLEIQLNERLRVIPGVRFDYYHELRYDGGIVPEFWDYEGFDNNRGISGEPSLRCALRYTLLENQTLKGAFGTYNQTPQPIGIVINDLFGNPAHPATKARHMTAGYEAQLTDLLSADFQIYHNSQWDIPDTYTSEDLAQNRDITTFQPEGTGRMYGLELLVRHDQGNRFFGWLAYSLSRSERFSRAENKWVLYDRDQTHNLQLIVNYRLKKQWEVGTRIRYGSGNPYTPVAQRINDLYDYFYEPVLGETNSERNGPFFQVDIRVDKKFVFDTWMFSAYLDLQNILMFFYASPELTLYDFDYTDKTVATSPFIPSFGLRAEF